MPGAGKTFAVMHAFKDACLSTPVNRLCQQLHWDHPEAMVQTVATFFGVREFQRSDDDQYDDGRGHRCRVDFGDRACVFDEAYMMSGQDMLRTLRWIHDNPEVRVYATGDPFQLDNPGQTWKPEMVERAMAKLFPWRIRLRLNKRCTTPEDQHQIARICKGLRASPSAEEARAILRREFRTTTNMAEAVQMMREGCVGVAYRNETNRIVSQMV